MERVRPEPVSSRFRSVLLRTSLASKKLRGISSRRMYSGNHNSVRESSLLSLRERTEITLALRLERSCHMSQLVRVPNRHVRIRSVHSSFELQQNYWLSLSRSCIHSLHQYRNRIRLATYVGLQDFQRCIQTSHSILSVQEGEEGQVSSKWLKVVMLYCANNFVVFLFLGRIYVEDFVITT